MALKWALGVALQFFFGEIIFFFFAVKSNDVVQYDGAQLAEEGMFFLDFAFADGFG